MALDGPDVARAAIILQWLGIWMGATATGLGGILGVRLLLLSDRRAAGILLRGSRVAVCFSVFTLVFSFTALAVLRSDQWCEIAGESLRLGPMCLPHGFSVEIVLLLALVGLILVADVRPQPAPTRSDRPLLLQMSRLEVARACAIGMGFLSCWLALILVTGRGQIDRWQSLELLVALVGLWLLVTSISSAALIAAQSRLRIAVAESCEIPGDRMSGLQDLWPGWGALAFIASSAVRAPSYFRSSARIVFRPTDGTRSALRSQQAKVPATVEAAFAACTRTLLGALAISCVINILMLTGPLYMLQVYDRVLTSRSVETLLMLTMLLVGLFIAMALLDVIRARVLSRIAVRLDLMLAEPLLSSALRVTASRSRVAAHSPLRDLDHVRQFASGPALAAMLDLPWGPLYFAIVFLLHPVLGLVALAGALVLVALPVVNQIATRGPLALAGHGGARCDALVEAGWRGAETLQALGMQGAYRQRWLDEHRLAMSAQLRANDIASSTSAATRVSRMLLQSLLLGAGAYLSLHESVSPGAMIAASIIAARALAPVELIAAHWRGIASAHTAVQRCRACLSALPADQGTIDLPPPRGELMVANLYATVPGGREQILKGVSFRLEPGDALAVLGPSAAGKSTLARALVGVWPLRHGEVRLDGAPLDQWRADDLGRHIGYLPQEVALFDGTVAENIARFEVDADPRSVISAAKAAGAHEMILRLESGYATRVGEGGMGVPGGQRQRIALARALYGDPALVVMDEPNANLDTEGEIELAAAISRLREAGRIVVVVAHRRSVLASVNRVLVLNGGKQVAFGPPAKVLRRERDHAAADATNDNRSAAIGVGRNR